MAIQTRRGLEADYDSSKLLPGEWAVSLDTKYVRMCFAPGVVYRMATYESFEEDMLQIQQILATCEDIQTAVEAFEELAQQHANDAAASATASANSATESSDSAILSKSWAVGGTGVRPGENTNNAEYWAGVAQAAADVQVMTPTQIGIGKPDDVTIGVSNGTFGVKKPVNLGVYTGDINDVPFYKESLTACRTYSDNTNLPSFNSALLETMYLDNANFAVQRATSFGGRLWLRIKRAGTWGEWFKMLTNKDITNNLLSTVPGTALDAAQGKALNDKITANTTDISTLNSNLAGVPAQCSAAGTRFLKFGNNMVAFAITNANMDGFVLSEDVSTVGNRSFVALNSTDGDIAILTINGTSVSLTGTNSIGLTGKVINASGMYTRTVI